MSCCCWLLVVGIQAGWVIAAKVQWLDDQPMMSRKVLDCRCKDWLQARGWLAEPDTVAERGILTGD
jgi:hypothetical protein